MTKAEIIYNIRNLTSGGITSDDTKLSDEQWSYIIDYYRARLIKQDLEKGRTNISIYEQSLGKVPLILADVNECCGEGCALRTEFKIPTPLVTGDDMILFVGLTDNTPIMLDKKGSINWSLHNKYTGKDSRWYYDNGYIYIVNPPTKMLSEIVIRGPFESPYDALKFRTCDCPANELSCSDFDPYNTEYPLPLHQVDVIVKMIAQTELRLLKSSPDDTSNDGQDQ